MIRFKASKEADVAAETAESSAAPGTESETTAEVSPGDEEMFWEEIRLIGSIRKIDVRRIELEKEVEDQRKVVKRAENELAAETTSLTDLQTEYKESTTELLDLNRRLTFASEGKKMPTLDDSDSKDAAWRARTTKDLLQGTKGLKGKKMTALCDAAPTVGDLEDLRAEASEACKPYHSVLPDGIGETVADRIEEAIANHVLDFSKAKADPERVQLAERLVKELREIAESSSWTVDECRPKETDSEMTHAGHSAFLNGKPFTDIPSIDQPKARQWILGWVGAERISALES